MIPEAAETLTNDCSYLQEPSCYRGSPPFVSNYQIIQSRGGRRPPRCVLDSRVTVHVRFSAQGVTVVNVVLPVRVSRRSRGRAITFGSLITL
jgi:hypothetical protein